MIDPNYAQPDALVTIDWLATHLNEPNTRLVESNEDILLYSIGHIPGAVHIDWRADLQDQTMRDYISPDVFAELCAKNGITKSTTVIFYGDKSNWWSCYALWAFRLFGHEKVKIVDGGRDKWIAENRPLTREVPSYPRSEYPVPAKRHDDEIRAFYEEALKQSQEGKPLIDVRSPGEFKGEITHMPEYPQEGVLRGGHIPGAKSFPWKRADGRRRRRRDAADPARGREHRDHPGRRRMRPGLAPRPLWRMPAQLGQPGGARLPPRLSRRSLRRLPR